MALRMIFSLFMMLGVLALPPETARAQTAPDASRTKTGGAPTLADIMARQNGVRIDAIPGSNDTGNPDAAAPPSNQLGTLGGASDPELWRAFRNGLADLIVSSRVPAAGVVMQDSGMRWLDFRRGPLPTYGGWLLLGMLAVLAVFYLIRGKIRLDGKHTGVKILRFSAIERFAHWLLGGSFIVLAVTGLLSLFGRMALIPLFGKEVFSPLAVAGKWAHNNMSWAFMLGLIMVTVFWIAHNIPNRLDLKWLAVGGGLFSKGVHPPAKKFNAGQKLIFWAVVVLGVSISVSGLSLLFPFQMPLFAATFDILNSLGLPQLFGFGDLPATLLPHEEMQLAQLWHAVIAFVFMAIIIGHIYIGSVGMEDAFDAMGSGEVEVQWAREHHSLWLEEVTAKSQANEADTPPGTPAQ
ncbi:MAG: formate dehydrogenase subunit gamma [Paracoccaceae bacterium]|nr:formate dehydrogenase subunit gamma [Paracoccaceae bacterium]